ncbi:Gp138 family membrane-puncturing spike protein [Achromobacter sp. PAB15]|uniref:Gp138 family membrane-puncturing spike protein n=1 Tax=Achromobacter sp. PAB15 TaxID=3233048 RepID=UPI003F93C819
MSQAVTLVRRLIATELSDVYTTLPGEVVAYDGVFVTARPTLAKRLANGETLPPPQIVRVPVCWPVGDVNGARALISVPLKVGDAIKLSFSARALENWLAGDNGPPDDPRQFDLSDAFASPLLRPGTMAADTQNVCIQYGPGMLKLSPAGDLTFQVKTWTVQAEQTTFNTPVTVNGPLTYTQGMAGEGGEGGASMRIRGGVAYEGGAIMHNGKNIGDTHRHAYAGGITENPV